VQNCQQEDDSIRKVVLKKATCDVESDVRWQVVAQKSSTEGRLIAQICQEKDVLWRRIRCKVTSCRVKVVNKRTTQCAKLSWKRRLVTSN